MSRRTTIVEAQYTLATQTRHDGSPQIDVRGPVSFASVERLRQELLCQASALPAGATLTLDLDGAGGSDSSLPALLSALERELERRNIALRVENADQTSASLMPLADARATATSTSQAPAAGVIDSVGEGVLRRWQDFRDTVQFVGELTLGLVGSLRHPRSIRFGQVLAQLQDAGTEAIPIVALMSVLVGLVTAFSSAIQLHQFGANILIANLIGIAMTREMGPLMAAVLVTGRSGSAFAAEIGTMKISDEIDALTEMGVRPMDYLIMPRLMALMLALPLLTLFADVCGIGGGLAISVWALHLTPVSFLRQLRTAIDLWDVFSGVLKAAVFGLLIASVGCHQGMITRGGAAGVGRQTTTAVVNGIFLVVLADSLFVVIFHYLGLG